MNNATDHCVKFVLRCKAFQVRRYETSLFWDSVAPAAVWPIEERSFNRKRVAEENNAPMQHRPQQ